MIYLACPFRNPDPLVQRKRCAAAHFVAAQLFLKGKFVFSPLTHNETLIDIINDEVPGEHWMQFDLKIFSICTELYVLKMGRLGTVKRCRERNCLCKSKGAPHQNDRCPIRKGVYPLSPTS